MNEKEKQLIEYICKKAISIEKLHTGKNQGERIDQMIEEIIEKVKEHNENSKDNLK